MSEQPPAPWSITSGPVLPDVAVPAPVQAVAAGRPARAVWENELGGLTFEVGAGAGLRAMHEALPVAACPFSWMAAGRLADVRLRAGQGRIDPARWHEDHQPLGLGRALELLADVPPVDRLVVCHGDSCAPNTLLTDDGRWSGHVDLGELGVADRWADLAIATWSTEWNYGPGWEGAAPGRLRSTARP